MYFKYIANTGLKISSIGYDALPLSLKRRPTEADAVKLIHSLLDLGINFIDTADSNFDNELEKHHNEKLICKALKSYRGNFGGYFKSIDDVIVATKCGLNNGRILHDETVDSK